MRIVEPSATLLSVTPGAEQLIERCGRVCYKSEDRITAGSAETFIRRIIDMGHHSVLEHASATILFVCDRGVTHELVRHRLAAYSQESTRYCNYGKDKHDNQISVIRPPGLEGVAFDRWEQSVFDAEDMYLQLLNLGKTPQIARSVLPNCLKTEIAMTANFREWRHVLTLRTAKAAHPQIREIMFMASSLLKCVAPTVFDGFAESE